MVGNWRLVILAGGLGVYLAGLGSLLAAVVGERSRFDQKPAATHSQQEGTARRWASLAMPPTQEIPVDQNSSIPHLRRVNAALVQGNLDAVLRSWHDYQCVRLAERLAAQGWRGMPGSGCPLSKSQRSGAPWSSGG